MNYELPLGYLSPSQVTSYMHCPACYERRYVLGERSPISVELPIGGAVHQAIEVMRTSLVTDFYDRPGEAVLEEFVTAGAEHCERFMSAGKEEFDLGSFSNTGQVADEVVRLCRFALPRLWELDLERNILAAEVGICSQLDYLRPGTEFNLPFEDVQAAWPFPTKAFADGLYGDEFGNVHLLSDVKTAKQRKMPDSNIGLQAAWYLRPFHVNGQDFPVLIDQIVKSAQPQHIVYSATVSASQHAEIYDAVLGVARGITAGNFPARPGWACSYNHNWPSFFETAA